MSAAGFPGLAPPDEARRGAWLSATTAALTAVAFAMAVLTPPLSGPMCREDCIGYPYAEIAGRFPRDYAWMFPAMALSVVVVALLAVVHRATAPSHAAFSLTALCLGTAGAVVLLADYWVQVAVVQPSVLQGERDGIALLTQYNPHGVFIALEEVGYLLIGFALLALAPALWRAGRLGRAIGWTAIAALALDLGDLAWLSLRHGVHREYRFEIAVISFVWLALIVTGTLLALLFRRAGRAPAS